MLKCILDNNIPPDFKSNFSVASVVWAQFWSICKRNASDADTIKSESESDCTTWAAEINVGPEMDFGDLVVTQFAKTADFDLAWASLFWAFACLSWPVLALAGRCVLQNFATWLNLRQRWHFTEDKGARHSVPCDDVLLPFCPNFTDLVVIPGP